MHKKVTRSDQQLKDDLEEHFHYEFSMFAYSFHKLKEGRQLSDPDKYMALECFLLHARNLYEFYYHSSFNDYARAVDFVPSWDKTRPAKTEAIKEQESRINLELSHLTYRRIAGSAPEKRWNYGILYNNWLSVTKTFLEYLPNKYIGDKLRKLKERICSNSVPSPSLPVKEANGFLVATQIGTTAISGDTISTRSSTPGSEGWPLPYE